MMITLRDLEAAIVRINRMTNSPHTPWTVKAGQSVACVGNFHISQAYGGVSLHRMVNESGGVEDVFSVGHVPKKALYHMMHAWIKGWEACRAAAAIKDN